MFLRKRIIADERRVFFTRNALVTVCSIQRENYLVCSETVSLMQEYNKATLPKYSTYYVLFMGSA